MFRNLLKSFVDKPFRSYGSSISDGKNQFFSKHVEILTTSTISKERTIITINNNSVLNKSTLESMIFISRSIHITSDLAFPFVGFKTKRTKLYKPGKR
jgi:hypothetical protein